MGHSYSERRKDQARATEKAILGAALTLMRGRGFDQVSVRDICRAAGITTGAFYHHFPSKEAILSRGFAPLDDYMEEALGGHGEEAPVQRLWLILETYARFMSDGGELTGRYYQHRMANPAAPSTDVQRYTLRAMLACFRQAETAGILAPGHSPEWVADFCFRHFRGVVIDWVLHGYAYPLLPRMQEDYALFETLFRAGGDAGRATQA